MLGEASSSTTTPPMQQQQMMLVHTPKAAPVTVAMPKTTAEAIALNKSIQEQARRGAAARSSSRPPPPRMVREAGAATTSPPTANVNAAAGSSTKGGFRAPTAPTAGNEGQAPRTIVVRTPDAMRLKVTVPSTTAEAVAMNKSIQEKARKDAAARERNASEILQRSKTVEGRRPLVLHRGGWGGGAGGGGGGGGAIASEHQATSGAPTEMLITPTARAKSLKIPVPLTTADAVAMNKAMRSRFSDTRTTVESALSSGGLDGSGSGLSGWDNARRAGSRSAIGEDGVLRGAEEESLGAPVVGTTPPAWSGQGQVQAQVGDGNLNFDQAILEHSRNLQWSQIIKIWQVERRNAFSD